MPVAKGYFYEKNYLKFNDSFYVEFEFVRPCNGGFL